MGILKDIHDIIDNDDEKDIKKEKVKALIEKKDKESEAKKDKESEQKEKLEVIPKPNDPVKTEQKEEIKPKSFLNKLWEIL
jgi:hypothetical protein